MVHMLILQYLSFRRLIVSHLPPNLNCPFDANLQRCILAGERFNQRLQFRMH